jgi:predicted nucleic acid-binding protein
LRNIVIAIFAAEQAVLARLGAASAIFVRIAVIGELFFGAHNSTRVQANVAHFQVVPHLTTIAW